jgi:hypothetical protein
MRRALVAVLLISLVQAAASQSAQPIPQPDSDHDGLTDEQEATLLAQFAPRFFIADHDCAGRPARFTPQLSTPLVASQDGTIYGQASPRAGHPGQAELHYYHLWSRDCGQMGHPLDAEHVSVLVMHQPRGEWRALYWYAAAHEDTLCDASQITRASTLDAEQHGPSVWISRGKHAAFLGEALCSRGCGGDTCGTMTPLAIASVVNVGEPGAAMNGALWTDSPDWPLADKLRRSDFPDQRTLRLQRLPHTDMAWANPQKRPAQAVILGGNDALGGGATGIRATDTALDTAQTHTSNALERAASSTGHALSKSYRNVKKALGASSAPAAATGPAAPSAIPPKSPAATPPAATAATPRHAQPSPSTAPGSQKN